MQKKFLTAEWRKLIIANYAIDPSILTGYLPYKTELDTWNGKCYVSLIGFRFMNTRLKGFPVPFHRNFEEVNLRFYVRYKEGDIWKRGVTFIKEIVPKPALTFVANSIYSEKYVTMPTKHSWESSEQALKISYQWRHQNKWDKIAVEADSTPRDILPESEEEFITEHYWGYTRLSERKTSQYQVEHPRWQTYPILSDQIEARFGDLYGNHFKMLEQTRPDSIMLAEGSAVNVRVADRLE